VPSPLHPSAKKKKKMDKKENTRNTSSRATSLPHLECLQRREKGGGKIGKIEKQNTCASGCAGVLFSIFPIFLYIFPIFLYEA
jgi:hypothetical protein